MKTQLRFLFLSLCLLLVSQAQSKEYYLATTGSDKNAGTIEKPFATLEKAISMLGAGDICFVRGGEYLPINTINITNSGTKDARICLFAYENEKPVFNFKTLPYDDNSRGIYHKIGANYWHYRGIAICNAGDNGMKMEGSFCVIENCAFYDNKDTGLQLGFGKGSKGENTRNADYFYGRYNIMLNCDSYNNYDPKTSGGDADGFGIKLYPGPGNEFHGCRAWDNSDDGWDLYYVHFPVVVNNCWTMRNGYDKGNGNGFKMGGGKQGEDMSDGAHIFTNCIATDNLRKGFDQNNHNEGTYMINTVSARNLINYGFNNDAPDYGKWTLRNSIGFLANERNHHFNAASTVDIQGCSWIDLDGCDKFTDRNKVPNPDKPGQTMTPKIADYTSQFVSLAYEDAIAERQSDGSLPLKFGRLKPDSKFIDAGVVISNFNAEDVKYPDYNKTLTIPYNGLSADMGAFEYGIDNNKYTLVMPENDGSVPEVLPENPDDEWMDDDGNRYKERILADWYPFQNAALPDSLNYMTGDGKIDLNYVGDVANGLTAGAWKFSKGQSVNFKLPSLCAFKVKLAFTGTRIIKVKYKLEGETAWIENSVEKAKGSYTIDIASMAIKSKKPMLLTIENARTDGGDISMSDLFVSAYQRIETEETGIHDTEKESFDIYQTQTDLIVYGQIASLKVYNLVGKLVSTSQKMQVVNIASLPKGAYIVLVKSETGKTTPIKFMKK